MIATAPRDEFARLLLVPEEPAPTGMRVGSPTDRERRFAVHRNNVVVSLIDALAGTFPVSQALVGETFFRAMARERVLADPPRSPVLIDYAHGFPNFVAGFEPAADVAYLADVARIEAMRVRAYHAADAQPLPEAAYFELAADPEVLARARLTLHPACHWLRSRHAAYSIWQAHQGLEDPTDADLQGIDTGCPQDVLIVRPQLDVIVAPLPPGGLEFLQALGAGLPVESAFQAAHAAVAEVDGGALFALLIRYGLAVAAESQPE